MAITRAGRGGSSVAVIDSIIGGLKPMRTGIFAWLTGKKQKVNDSAPSSFGKEVLEAVKNSKGTTEEELASEMKGVLDSCAILKDCEAKDALLNVVRDCFDNKEMALANEEELTATLDSMWIEIHGDSLKEMAKAFESLGKKAEPKPAVEDTANKDSSDENKEEKTEDSEAKEGEEKTEDSEEKKDDDACSSNKDSAPVFATKDDIVQAVKDSIKPMVMEAVKECLGIKDDAKPEVTGGVVDSAINKEKVVTRDYSSFLE